MKGDITRSTFRGDRHYQSVRMQQGRVQLDADWNEQVDIQLHLDETTRRDVIGGTGVPKNGGGFEISALDGPDLAISDGRMYVDGMLCELDCRPVAVDTLADARATVSSVLFDGTPIVADDWLRLSAPGETDIVVRVTTVDVANRFVDFAPALTAAQVAAFGAAGASVCRVVSYSTQHDSPGADHLDAAGVALVLAEGTYLAYLDVWRRHVTALEDPDLLESALGGPDTTTRVRTACQVKLVAVPAAVSDDGCEATWPELEQMIAGSSGRLRARAVPETDATNLCELPPRAGYRRLENQLYRVEVHDGGALGAATFKWSRDNGSVVSRLVGQDTTTRLRLESTGRDAVLSFAPGELAEITDDGRELRGEPGDLVEVVLAEGEMLEVATAVNVADFGPGAKVRRWNNTTEETVAIAADNDGFLALEDGVEVRFDTGTYATGDYWLIPARTLETDIVWPRDANDRPDAVAPEGIEHAYARLAIVTVDAAGMPTAIDDCRPPFPTLTEICAEDICFDNDHCEIPDAVTVQDALDHLCQNHDHEFHNKHLHGWGVVCGLQVQCASDRNEVVVRDGYAIDCEGRDIIVGKRVDISLMKRVERLAEELGTAVLDDNGDGEVCLTLALDEQARTTFGVEPFDPNERDLTSLLQGTLLLDFYQDCILRLKEFIDDELSDDDNEDADCVSPARRRLAALTNVIAPALNQKAGHSVFVSQAEHEMVLGFYERLRELLRSETYCAMFDNARPFPEYPLDDLGIRTIYGRGFHTRLRAQPGGRELYTVGAGVNPLTAKTRINRYDLRTDCLTAEIDPLAGGDAEATDTGVGAVEDVAFSPDGKTIYVIARAKGDRDTYFRSGRLRGGEISWGPLATMCGARLVTLATTNADPKNVYAIGVRATSDDKSGEGDGNAAGLYRIDPRAPEDEPAPLVPFNAVGHLEVDANGRAAATASSGNGNSSYDHVLLINLPGGETRATIGYDAPGTDDIAIHAKRDRARREAVYAVIGEGNAKRVVAHDLNTGAPIAAPNGEPAQVFVEDTTIRLQPIGNGLVVRTLEDHYSVRMFDPESFNTVGTAVPMQVGPIAIDVTDERQVAVLNFASNTIVVADAKLFDPDFKFPHEALASYKRQALEAFVDLAAGLLQYLKDCLCDHFLVDCPECDEDSTLYLACVSIRGGRVYKVCNFSKRRDVKTWPKVAYWASIFPIMPLAGKAVEWFCCLVLPDLFGRYEAPDIENVQHDEASKLGFDELRGGVATTQAFDAKRRIDDLSVGGRKSVKMTRQGLALPGGFGSAIRSKGGRMLGGAKSAGLGSHIIETLAGGSALAANELNPFEPLLDSLRTLGGARARAAPTETRRFEASGGDEGGLRAEVDALATALAAREDEVAQLRTEVEEQRAVRTELDTLKAVVDRLKKR